jgi:hypothetical protein
MATLDVSPTRVRPNRVQVVTFIGNGTAWGSPTFTPSGVAGVSCGAVSVISPTVATAPVTYGSATGVIVWTDSTTSATRNQIVSASLNPRWVPSR